MTVNEVVSKLDLTVEAGETGLEHEVTGGYVSDLLSDVMANAREGDVWVTLQIHQNVVAVALLAKVAAVILVGDRKPDSDTAEKADGEGIPILSTGATAFESVVRLHEIGVGGARR